MKGGGNIEIIDENLDECSHNKTLYRELAMQIISNDKIVRNISVQDLKDFNLQSLATRAKKGEQLVSMMPAIKKDFDLMGDDVAELSTEREFFDNKIG